MVNRHRDKTGTLQSLRVRLFEALTLVAVEVSVALLPHHVLNTWLKYEEKSNGIREYFPKGVREVPR